MKRMVSGIILTLLLISFLTLAVNIQLAKASGTIYIRPDGSIDPPTARIQRDGDVYTFTDDINNSIVVERDNIIVDGSGYTLRGSGNGRGFYLYTRSNVTIRNTEIQTFGNGIYLSSSSNINIFKNNLSNNGKLYNGAAIKLYWSHSNNISWNNVTDNYYGIFLLNSRENTLRNNAIADNRFNFNVIRERGTNHSYFFNDVDTSNTVNGRKMYYLIEKSVLTVPSDAGYVALVRCHSIRIENLTLENNGQGALFVLTWNLIITNNNIISNLNGVYLFGAFNISICSNDISNNGKGIGLTACSNNNIFGNNIANNDDGIWFYDEPVDSSNNSIYHNNFIGNTQHVYIGGSGYRNTWDDGYPSGGNYWSHYTGNDWYSGPYQNETGSDGIGDTPHSMYLDNQDRYPLMKPYPWDPHDVGITRIASKTVIGQGFTLTIDVTVFNYGMYAENFNVTAYINATIIDTFADITLTSRNSTTITFTWNTTGVAKGNYIVTATVTPVSDEKDLTDNIYTHSIMVTILGDINGDWKVDGKDIAIMSKHFGCRKEQFCYVPNADINCDGKIDGKDVAIAAKNFGHVEP